MVTIYGEKRKVQHIKKSILTFLMTRKALIPIGQINKDIHCFLFADKLYYIQLEK